MFPFSEGSGSAQNISVPAYPGSIVVVIVPIDVDAGRLSRRIASLFSLFSLFPVLILPPPSLFVVTATISHPSHDCIIIACTTSTETASAELCQQQSRPRIGRSATCLPCRVVGHVRRREFVDAVEETRKPEDHTADARGAEGVVFRVARNLPFEALARCVV